MTNLDALEERIRATNGYLGLLKYPTADVIAAAHELRYIRRVDLIGGGTVELAATLNDLNGQARDFRSPNPFREIAKVCERMAAERAGGSR